MSDSRQVPMTAEQAEILDRVIVPALMRSNDTNRASHMMALTLAYKFADEQEPELPSNVVELHGHSKKVPCA